MRQDPGTQQQAGRGLGDGKEAALAEARKGDDKKGDGEQGHKLAGRHTLNKIASQRYAKTSSPLLRLLVEEYTSS